MRTITRENEKKIYIIFLILQRNFINYNVQTIWRLVPLFLRQDLMISSLKIINSF
jgi:hypothetical protein